MDQYTIGVIGDTHGLLRAEALTRLEGCDHIIHTGDVGRAQILNRLRAIAPTTAVRGNVDHGEWAQPLPMTHVVEFGEVRLYVLHDLQTIQLDPRQAGFHAVLYGHSHRPRIAEQDDLLFLNPGSAGPRRFRLPVTMAYLHLHGQQLQARLVHLLPPSA